MKNMFENFAVTLVVILSIAIVYLIVQYNMIDDSDTIDEIAYQIPEVKEVSKKEKATAYLQNLEGYTDVDVQVDPTQEGTANRVEVRSEIADDALDAAVEDKDKDSYAKSLENYYSEESEKKREENTEPEPAPQKSYEPEKLEHEEIVDEIGLAISEALEDL